MFVQLNFFLEVPILLSTRSETLVEVVQVNSKIEFINLFKDSYLNQSSENKKGDINTAFVKQNSGASKLVLQALDNITICIVRSARYNP